MWGRWTEPARASKRPHDVRLRQTQGQSVPPKTRTGTELAVGRGHVHVAATRASFCRNGSVTCKCVCMHTHVHTYVHTHMHTHVHTRTHTCTHVHVHTHTREPQQERRSCCGPQPLASPPPHSSRDTPCSPRGLPLRRCPCTQSPCVHSLHPSSQLCDNHALLETGLTRFTSHLSQSRNVISDNAAITGTCKTTA